MQANCLHLIFIKDNMQTLSHYIELFKKYTSGFVYDDPEDQSNSDFKISHSEAVLDCAIKIIEHSVQIQKSPHLIPIMQLSALYHDIGRFEQFKQYKTYSDAHSTDHALLGVKILHKKGYIKDLPIKSRQMIYGSIAFHNKKSVPELNHELKLCVNLVRDADKLDIFRLMLEHLNANQSNEVLMLGLKNERDKYSENLIQKILKHEVIDYKENVYVNDMIINILGWIYQLNFSYSYQWVKTHLIHHQIIQLLPQDAQILQLKEHFDTLLERGYHEL